jgi:hypothetical protein
VRHDIHGLPASFARVTGRVTGRKLTPTQAAWLAGIPALLLLAPSTIPGQLFWLGIPAFAVVIAVARRRGAGWVLILGLLGAGVALRIWLYGYGWSGVLAVTGAAEERVRAGLSPWNIGYPNSLPPGEPFPYGPTELAWYAPFSLLAWFELRWVEFACSCGLLAALAVRGRPVGLAIAALTPVLWMTASDGSNDTSAGIVLLLALLLARRGAVRGAIGLGIAGGFKFHALAWVPGLVLLGGWPAAAAFGATTLAIWAPALLFVGPGPIIASLRWAEGLHDWAGWSLAGFVESIVGGKVPGWPFEVVRWVGGAIATGVVVIQGARRGARGAGGPERASGPSRGAFLAGGLGIFLVVLYAGYWSTHGYLAQVAPILCWEVDELAGLPRVALPARLAGLLHRPRRRAPSVLR